jgi:hypothetical protein
MDQLNPQDAQFLYFQSEGNLTHLTTISILDQSTVPGGKVVRFRDILEHVESRLHMSPVFKRRLEKVPLELDFPYWVDDENFDLEYHVRHVRLPKPGDWRQFCIQMARYHSRSLDMSKPLWEGHARHALEQGRTPAQPAPWHSRDGRTGGMAYGALANQYDRCCHACDAERLQNGARCAHFTQGVRLRCPRDPLQRSGRTAKNVGCQGVSIG